MKLPAIKRELLFYYLGKLPFPPHPGMETAVIYITAMAVLYLMPYLIRPVGKSFIQPVFEDKPYRSVQPDDGISCP
jgi:hypothetical protein